MHQQCDLNHWYTNSSHYWHMPLPNVMYIHTHIHMCDFSRSYLHPTAKSEQQNLTNIYLAIICASNKYAPQCHISHLHKFLDMHQWWKHPNTYATYQLTNINHITRTTVQCQQNILMHIPGQNQPIKIGP